MEKSIRDKIESKSESIFSFPNLRSLANIDECSICVLKFFTDERFSFNTGRDESATRRFEWRNPFAIKLNQNQNQFFHFQISARLQISMNARFAS